MFRPHSLLVLLVCFCCGAPLHGQSLDLPSGPLQAKVTTACTECHSSRIIVQQRLGKGAWTKEVDKMVKWGALVPAADRDLFIEYLSSSFSPEKARAEMPRSVKSH